MDDLGPGLFESLITEGLRHSSRRSMSGCFRSHRGCGARRRRTAFAWHLSRQIQRALSDVSEGDRVAVGAAMARDLLQRLGDLVTTGPQERPVDPAEVLTAILAGRPDGAASPVPQPLIPLLDTTLLTNAPGEPSLWSQLQSEIESADAIDVVMAFIRRSGISPLLSALRRHTEAGKALRVLTTTYTGSTEGRALDQLADLGGDVRISDDLGSTRLHAKAWVFHRRSGFSTAYVGSSNLTQQAQVTGFAPAMVRVVRDRSPLTDRPWQRPLTDERDRVPARADLNPAAMTTGALPP